MERKREIIAELNTLYVKQSTIQMSLDEDEVVRIGGTRIIYDELDMTPAQVIAPYLAKLTEKIIALENEFKSLK
jgi:hypothetical protein